LEGTLRLLMASGRSVGQLRVAASAFRVDDVLIASDLVAVIQGEDVVVERGPALDKRAKEALVSLTRLRPDPDDDGIFATGTTRAAGDSWLIDRSEVQKQLEQQKVHTSAKDISGTAKLVAIESHGGVDCEKLTLQMHVSPIRLDDAFPPGIKLKGSSADIDYR